jgi:fructosamine-3-kinase
MHLAELTLTMHEHTSSHYQRVSIGPAKQFESWPAFYHDVYDSIWHEADKLRLLPPKCRKQICKIHEKIDRLLVHSDKPRLVHWDIWSTNLLARPDDHGRWWVSGILDPNCKFADAEAELAYMELFHTITPAFLRTYQQTHRLSPEYARYRKAIYQLYPLINHLRLFGQEYVRPLTSAVEQLGALV